MPTSTKPKSQHGENGQDDKELKETDNQKHQETTADCESTHTLESSSLSLEPEAVVVAEELDKTDIVSDLSPADRRIADRMTRDIANHLGLSGRSRSVKI
jgi:hypothetical protein